MFLINKLNVYSFSLNSSSDSDSDPEGGELPDIPYRRREEEELIKKQVKKKRPEKAIEERVQILARKREVRYTEIY